MENLIIEETEFTPDIFFNTDNQTFVLKGVSRPENVQEFYNPAIKWLDDYEKEILSAIDAPAKMQLKITFHFSYFNSSSSKMLLQLLTFFAKQQDNGFKVIVDFYYDEGDDQMLEDGEELQEILGIPFNFIEE
jgi:hypothetical protein